MDDMRLRITSNRLNSCVTVIMETWLHENIPDLAVEQADDPLYRTDRTADSGKTKGGGKTWFTSKVRELYRAQDVALQVGNEEYKRAEPTSTGASQLLRDIEHIEENLNDDPRAMWRGVKNLTNYKQSNRFSNPSDPSLPGQLNSFFARLEDSSNIKQIDNYLL
ncbi:hypothetical protein WMY93_018226 [Mugilogobius chulae]|uniref:Uncharacterized protein n=1 Tax=Mugilogobius chulae TaxID=88201 RepID=A0AAW0NTB9_9GOBI